VCQRAVDGAEGAGLAGVSCHDGVLARAATRPLCGNNHALDEQLAAPDTPGLAAVLGTREAGLADRTGLAEGLWRTRRRPGTPRRRPRVVGPARDGYAESLDLVVELVRGSKGVSEGGQRRGPRGESLGGWLGSVVGPDVACWAVCTVSSFLICRSGLLAGLRLFLSGENRRAAIPVWDSAALRCRPDALSGWITPGFEPAEGPLVPCCVFCCPFARHWAAFAPLAVPAPRRGRRRKGIGLHLCRCRRYRGRLIGRSWRSAPAEPAAGRRRRTDRHHASKCRAGRRDDRAIGHLGEAPLERPPRRLVRAVDCSA